MDDWIFAHRAALDIAARAIMTGAISFALWSISRDLRAAWPRIVQLFKERDNHDT